MSGFSLSDRARESEYGIPRSGIRLSRIQQRYGAIRYCLEQYLSRIMVDSCIKQALARHNLTAPRNGKELEGLVEEIMVGLRLFVAADKLPELMLALSELLEENG